MSIPSRSAAVATSLFHNDGVGDLRPLSQVLADTDARLSSGQRAAARVWATGFPLLDTYLSGGLRAGELSLLGGPQGLGKTTFALQVLRNVVAAGGAAVYFSFEHDASTVLERLVAAEAGQALELDGVSLRRVREAMEASGSSLGRLEDRLGSFPGGAEAVRAVAAYSERVFVYRATGESTDVAAIRAAVAEVTADTGQEPVVVVDYLQKVHVPGDRPEEEEVTRVVEGLKDVALDLAVPVLAVVAADKDGLASGKRLRVHHLRGSSALAYEADVVLVMNDKYDVVARHHLVYDVSNAERYREFVVLSIEKNRSGLDKIDLEFRKRLEHGRFEPDARPVAEQLVDERVFVE